MDASLPMAPSQTTANFEQFQAELASLVDRFDRQFPEFTSPDYNEATLRADFLDPFFRALGWDVGNTKGLIHTEREVDIEVRTAVSGRQTRADYVFRAARVERFTCEAKKPEEVLSDPHIFQAKRDAFARGVPLALLSDFQELKIFVVGARPHRDEPHVGEWKVIHFRQYLAAARELWDLLAYQNVTAGSIDRLIDSLPKRPLRLKGKQGYLIRPDRTRSLDADFLNFLDDVRQQLGSDLLKHNDRADLLAGHRLNEAAQRIIDRLVFLRICEDRGIDTGQLLQSLFDGWYRQQQHPPRLHRPGRQTHLRFGTEIEEDPAPYDAGGRTEGSLYREIVEHVRSLDQRPPSYKPFFNGQLFKPHFSEDLTVGDEWLANFILDLTDDDTGYNFATIKVEILGDVYERFLGKVLRPQGRGATIEEKPEVRKAGGVYYTPRYITDYIVEQTVGRLLEGKTPKEIQKLSILDPACGSGSFLLRAYERVMEHYLRWFTADPKKRRKEDCYVDAVGNVRLTTRLKRRILEENIYGVDIDAQAVEVTQLSLYLKMLEGENRETLRAQTELFRGEALLPPLDQNIRCFNSLIASDFSLDPDDLVRVNAGDWEVQFPAIMKAGGFDAVLGNPPYVRIQGFPESQVAYFTQTYRAAAGNYDLYVNFVEKGLSLLNKSGEFGMILPNKFFRTDYGEGLRTLLSKSRAVRRVVDFGANQVFEATTYTCLLFLAKTATSRVGYAAATASRLSLESAIFREVKSQDLGTAAWSFSGVDDTNLLKKIRQRSVRLLNLPADMSRGSSTGDDEVFVLSTQDFLVEKSILRIPLFASDFGRYRFGPSQEWRVIFPYVDEENDFRVLKQAELKKEFPKTFDYLTQNADRLRKRKQYKEWFGFSAPRNLKLHNRAQIAVPLLANTGCFALIPKSAREKLCPMASGGFTITLGNECQLVPEFILGLLNSKLLFWVLRSLSNVFRGGWITCTKQYFGELPIVSLHLENQVEREQHDRLVAFVDKMLTMTPAVHAAKTDAERHALQNALAKTDHDIDQLVYQLYGLTPEEIALVEGAAAAPAREAH
jgi:hypothetical protein